MHECPNAHKTNTVVYRGLIMNFENYSFRPVLSVGIMIGSLVFQLKSIPMKPAILVFIQCIFAFTLSQAQEFDYSFKESYDVSAPAQLDLSSFDGNLDIIPNEENKILVYYIVKKGGKLLKIDRSELAKELIIEAEQNKNSVRVSVRQREHRTFSFESSIGVHFKVYVPRKTACVLATSDGNISIQKLISDQQCKTSDGSIEITDIAGNVKGKTSDGDVRVRQIKGYVDVATSDGSIRLASIAGNVQAST